MYSSSELQLFRCISGTDLDGKIEKASIIKERENFFPTLKKSDKL